MRSDSCALLSAYEVLHVPDGGNDVPATDENIGKILTAIFMKTLENRNNCFIHALL